MQLNRSIARLFLVLTLLTSNVAFAQQNAPAFLVIDQDRLLAESLYGQQLLEFERQSREELLEQRRALDRQFEQEELEISKQRSTLENSEFRALADDFDLRVNAARQAQEQRTAERSLIVEQGRRDFFNHVAPVLLNMLDDTGASAVVDLRSVLIIKQELNFTDEIIRRLDARYRAELRDDASENNAPAD